MNVIFPGRIALDDGDAVDVALTVEGAELRLATPAAHIGSWPLVSCRLDELGPGRYRLTVDDDFVDFSPTEPDVFASFLASLGVSKPALPEGGPVVDDAVAVAADTAAGGASDRFAEATPDHAMAAEPMAAEPMAAESMAAETMLVADMPSEMGASPETIADAIVEESRERPTRPFPVRMVALGAGALGIVVLLGIALLSGDGASLPESDPAASEAPAETRSQSGSQTPTSASEEAAPVTSGPASTAVEPVNVGGATLFDIPAADVVADWNGIAEPISPALRVGIVPAAGTFETPLTSDIAIAGTVGADGTFDGLTVVVNGTSGVSPLGLQALGVGVAVAEPNLSGPGRAGVLASLGFDVASPAADGIDATVTRSGYTYRLIAVGGRIELIVRPR